MTDLSKKEVPLFFNPTINQQIRNRRILRDEKGVSIGKAYRGRKFHYANQLDARETIKNEVFTLHDNPFDSVE